MAESMWDDVKKLSDLLYHQTKEQKDILLLKLRLASFSSKRDAALAKLGRLVYKPLKDGKNRLAEDKGINGALNELIQIDKDVERTEKELGELRAKTADKRSELGEELGKTWEKTKTAIKPKTEPDNETSKAKSKSDTPAEPAGPAKKAKKSRAKSSAAKTAKDGKKGSKESDESC